MTSLVVSCPNCSQQIDTPADLLHQEIQCPACDAPMLLEGPEQEPANTPKRAKAPQKVTAQRRPTAASAEQGDVVPEGERDILLTQPTAKAFLGEIIFGCLLAPIGIGLILLAAVWYKTKALRYRLTNERLFVHKGLIAKSVEEIELYRVKDQNMRQGIVQRLLGFGSVTVYSTDDSTPLMTLVGINQPMAVKESIRSAVRDARRNAGVRMTEYAES